MVDNIGLPISGINLTYNNTGMIGAQDGDIQIALKEGHAPTADYVQALREELPRAFPGVTFSFLPADIVSQILNFGAPAPIDLQIRGANLDANFAYANKLLAEIRRDSRRRRRAHPAVAATIRASTSMSTARARSRSASPSATSPTAWSSISPAAPGRADLSGSIRENGVSYPIVMQTPQYQIDSLTALQNLPITAGGTAARRSSAASPTSRARRRTRWSRQYDIQSMVQIYATTQGRDLGAVAADIQQGARRHRQGSAEGQLGRAARPGADDEQRVFRPAVRPARRDRADLSADRRELPVVGRSVRDHHRAAGRARRHRLDAVRDAHARCRCRR